MRMTPSSYPLRPDKEESFKNVISNFTNTNKLCVFSLVTFCNSILENPPFSQKALTLQWATNWHWRVSGCLLSGQHLKKWLFVASLLICSSQANLMLFHTKRSLQKASGSTSAFSEERDQLIWEQIARMIPGWSGSDCTKPETCFWFVRNRE